MQGTRGRPMSIIRAKLFRDERLRWRQPREIAFILQGAIERAGLPVERKSGSRGHYNFQLAPAAPAWHFRSCEYADFALNAAISSGDFGVRLSAALPEGFALCWARRYPSYTPGLAGSLVETGYNFYGCFARSRVEAFFAATAFPYRRVKKDRQRDYDLRDCVSGLAWFAGRIEIVLKTLDIGAVRPHEAVAAIFAVSPEEVVLMPTERTHMRFSVAAPFSKYTETL
jgi:hypothetical protein